MFDKIKFEEFVTPFPITPKTIDDYLSQTENPSSLIWNPYNEVTKRDITNSKNEMIDLDFCFDGTLKIFYLPPISSYAKEHLYYLKDFCIFYLTKPSYTIRSYLPHYTLLYTYQGYGSLDYGGKTYHLGEGDGFFIDGRNPHTYRCIGDQWVHSISNLKGPLIDDIYQNFIKSGSPLFTQSVDDSLQQGLENLLHIYSTGQPYRDWQASSCIDSFLTNLLVSSLKNTSRNVAIPGNMQYLIHYIENNYLQPLSMEYLSSFSGISRAHLTREFKKYTGYTPNAYIIQLRLNHAKKLLASSKATISAIAFESGFHDINNFINLFKKDTGITPGAYRKQLFQCG